MKLIVKQDEFDEFIKEQRRIYGSDFNNELMVNLIGKYLVEHGKEVTDAEFDNLKKKGEFTSVPLAK